MNENDKARWVAALRSGAYNQVDGALRLTTEFDANDEPVFGYCCLGVLCEVHPDIERDSSDSNYVVKGALLSAFDEYFVGDHDGSWERDDGFIAIFSDDFPEPLFKHFGMDPVVETMPTKLASGPRTIPINIHSKLVRMNDGGSSFAEIADYIEANL